MLIHWFLAFVALPATFAASKPHIVLIVADDLGWNDVGFTGSGSNIRTPTLDALAKSGVVLHNYYVSPICTPTRNCLMSGRYPIHTGLQHSVILDSLPSGLPLNETVIASVMKKAGYATHMVGKWHLGFYKYAYTPQHRGFDTFFGYYTGNEEFWNHTSPCWGCGNYTGLDLHRATAKADVPIRNASGIYSTNLFADEAIGIIEAHDPQTPLFLYLPFEAVHGAASCEPDCFKPYGDLLQAPQYYIDQQSHITNTNRRTYGGMVGALDDAVKNITETLKARGMMNQTLIVFTTDNGAPAGHFNGEAMNNWPLRGTKGTLWEGGVRGAAFVHGYGIEKTGYFNGELLHATDWFATFAYLAGVDVSDLPLDGYNVWDTIAGGKTSPRTEILHNIDPIKNTTALRVGDWKLMTGMTPAKWYPMANMSDPDTDASPPKKRIYLYNIADDPTERNNLVEQKADVVKEMLEKLDEYRRSAVPCRYPDPDPNANPNLRSGMWEPWMD